MDTTPATRTAELKFIKESLTPLNPKDIYHQSLDSVLKLYYGIVLVGMLMVTYMLIN